MTIVAKDKVVSFNYRLYDDDLLLEDATQGPGVLYLHGHNGIFDALEESLLGKSKGDEVVATLTPDQAYGYRKNNSTQRVSIKNFSSKKRLRPGMVTTVNTSQGPREVVVIKAGRFNVDVDTNHPFAGRTLRFEITVGEIRDASEEELAHGHAHGHGGHQH